MRALLQPFLLRLRSVLRSERGQTLVEYALILAIISAIAVGVFAILGARIQLVFSAVNNLLDTGQSSH